MKFNIDRTSSYNSIHPAYQYTEQFDNNVAFYRDGTNWYGIFLAFVSGAFFTVSAGLVKAITNVDPMVLLAIRAVLQMIVMLACAIKENHSLLGPKGSRMLLHLQGIVGGMTLALLYYSFRTLPLGDATTIIFSSPVIVILMSFIFLKEPCGLLRIVVICALLAGVVLVAKPPFIFETHKSIPYDVLGYVYALLATLFTALNIVVMRKCSEIHFSVLVFNLSAWIFGSSVLFFFVISEARQHVEMFPQDWLTWGLIMSVALTGLSGQVLVTKALKIEGAGKVSVTRSLDIILAFVIQVYFFGEEASRSSVVGAALILASVVCMGFEREIYGFCDFIP